MTNKYFSRRGMLKGSAATGALLATAGSLDLLGFAKAWAADAPIQARSWREAVADPLEAFRAVGR